MSADLSGETSDFDTIRQEVVKLIESVDQEREACERLLVLNIEERSALISGQVDRLGQVVEEKESLINLIGRIEEDCSFLTRRWSVAMGGGTLGPRLERLLPVIGDDLYGQLRAESNSLTVLVRQVTDGNRANAELIRDFLRVTTDLLNELLDLSGANRGYSSVGLQRVDLKTSLASVDRCA